jgi:predicted Zn-ribbon and HTH transcriptional regulator
MDRPPLEVADVFREHGESYRQLYGSSMSVEQWRAMRAIELCRTAALGGHVDRCDQCGHQVISYNSCRNRHCPKCQNLEKALWREARRAEVLPVPYYHVVFTLPRQLVPLALQNQRMVYDSLFRAASQTLLRIGADPKHLGAQLGFMAVLHTWGQTLMYHAHLHCVVPGGGLAPDGNRWRSCKKRFFLPVRVLSRLFRRLFLEALEKAFRHGRLQFHGPIAQLTEQLAFQRLLQSCRRLEWVVFAKPPFAGANAVLDYLARYTHRIAISNHRLTGMQNGKVTFAYKDYKTGRSNKTMTLDAHEFIRRFLLHVLPSRFQRIRYYGFLANCQRADKLALCRHLLQVTETTEPPEPEVPDRTMLLQALLGEDPSRCPRCNKGHLNRFALLPPSPPLHHGPQAQGRSP